MSLYRTVQPGDEIVSRHFLMRRAKIKAKDLTALSVTQDVNENWIHDEFRVRRAQRGPYRWYVVKLA